MKGNSWANAQSAIDQARDGEGDETAEPPIGMDQLMQHGLVLLGELHELRGNTTEPGARKTCFNPAMQADNGLGDRSQAQPGELTLVVQ